MKCLGLLLLIRLLTGCCFVEGFHVCHRVVTVAVARIPLDISGGVGTWSSGRPKVPSSSRLKASLDDDNDVPLSVGPSFMIFGGIPLLSLGLVLLLQFKMLASLLIAKRLYIYSLAATVLAVASDRGASDKPGLGTRLVDLTREILPNYKMEDEKTGDQRFQEMVVLDEVDDSAQALGLPLLVISSLVASLFFVLIQHTDFSSGFALVEMPFLESVQSILPNLMTISNALVLSLFARAELTRLPLGNDAAATGGAFALTALAFFGPASIVWPIQNILCVCLAISVARAIQLPRIAPILLALTGLVLYDVASVGVELINLGSMSMTANGEGADVMNIDAASASSSAMGAVALSKATGDVWQPGLFVVRLRGIVTDLLGLGDSVFPSLLSTFCLRFDREEASSNSFSASLIGFVGGCLACEFVPGISSSGLPALLFIIPSMLTAVGVSVLLQGNIESFWKFDAMALGAETEKSNGSGL